MKVNFDTFMYESTTAKFSFSQQDRGEFGLWHCLSRLEQRMPLTACGVWHESEPLDRFRGSLTTAIVDFLETDLQKWIDPRSVVPLAVPESFRMTPSHILYLSSCPCAQNIDKEALSIIFDYADIIATKLGELEGWRLPHYQITWASGDGSRVYPEPDLRDLLLDSPINVCAKCILLMMRYSGPYDGDTDMVFERRFPLALRLLFSGTDRAMVSFNVDESSRNQPSLLSIYESPELTDNVHDLLAKAAHPVLMQLLRKYEDQDVLPSHCFVYGLHVSRIHLSVFVHFPLRTASSDGRYRWEFAQVLLARHLISVDSIKGYEHMELFLSCWRILITLLTISKHVQFLSNDIKIGSAGLHPVNIERPFSIYKDPNFQAQSPSHLPKGLTELLTVWKNPLFAVPADWIVPNTYKLDTTGLQRKRDLALLLQRHIATVSLYRVRMVLQPLSPSDLTRNHLAQDYYGPDFLLPTHSPRSRFASYSKEPIDPECNTLPHLYKAHDFLVMSAPKWEDVPIFIANLFSGFANYAVQWMPIIQYPFPVSSSPTDLCVVDFALAVRTIPATTCATIGRAPKLPMTIGSPAVLICARPRQLKESGHFVSREEVTVLTGIMKPHLQLFQTLERHDNLTLVPDHPRPDPYPTLFCVYVKTGFLHILAFTCEPRLSGPNIHSYLVDSLPVSLDYETEADLRDRMRIVMALFTLQREVVKISDGWSSICWPSDVLNEEHEKIVQLTGIHTPNATENLSEPGEELHVFFDQSEDDMEDDPEVMKKQIAASVERVIEWRSRLESSDEGEDIVMGDVW